MPKRSAPHVAPCFAIELIRRFACAVGVDAHPGAHRGVLFRDRRKALLDERSGGRTTFAYLLPESGLADPNCAARPRGGPQDPPESFKVLYSDGAPMRPCFNRNPSHSMRRRRSDLRMQTSRPRGARVRQGWAGASMAPTRAATMH